MKNNVTLSFKARLCANDQIQLVLLDRFSGQSGPPPHM